MTQRGWGSALFATVSICGVLLGACGGNTVAESIRPKDQTYAAAMGEPGGAGAGTCHEVDTYGEPLVVDWKPEQRGDLEVAMQEGVALVAYSCKGIKLLKDCKLDGKYGFLGMTKKEQLVRLQNQDEVRANLPLGGIGIAAKIGGEMERGTSLDVALVMIGKRKTTWAKVSKDDLTGDCDGATHFVRGATVGAFVMETGSKAQARTAAQIFGAGASGDSASAKNMRNQDGDPKDCSSSSPDATKAPAQCGALLRLELKALTTGAGATAPAGAPSAAKDPPRPAVAQVSAPEEPCPKGLVFTDGKCAPPASASAHQCDPSDLKGCTEQCDKGNPASCGALGTLFLNGGSGAARDATKARSLLAKACDGGNVKSCVNLGILEQSGQGGAKDTTAAAKHFEQGCKDADAAGCGMLGTLFQSGDGVKKDDTRAAVLFGQACEGGQDASCAALAVMKRDGVGGAKDPAKAAELFKRACDGTDAASCNEFGEIHAFGPAKNEILAGIMFMRACNRGSAAGCANQGRVLIGGMRSDPDGAKRAFEQACIRQSQVGCASLKVLFGDTRPVFPNVAEMNTLMRSCAGGNARDCTTSGLLQVASGNKAMGMPNIDRACIMNDGFACALKKAIK